jgi:type II secretory ATPase GspE/PulE/Tfp pilus assembly ATPase PilB-like protein
MQTFLAQVTETGGYFSLAKIIVTLVALPPWLYAATKIPKDAKKVHASPAVWGGVALVGGGLGVLLLLTIPFYAAGILMYVVLALASLLSYAVYRDSRLEEGETKILSVAFWNGVFIHKAPATVHVQEKVRLYDNHGKVYPGLPPEAEERDVAVYNLAQELLYDMIWRRASQAILVPEKERMTIRFVIDGAVSVQPELSLEDGQAIIQMLKPLAGMDPKDYRRPQQGEFSVDFGSKRIDITASAAGTTGGQRMHFKVIQEVIRQKIGELGMSDDVLKTVRETTKNPGLLIISGRGGSGVTSTMYSILREHDAFMKQIVTLESKPAVPLENITQNAYGDPQRLTEELANALRRDPDVLMIDQCPDKQTAEMILQAAAEKSVILGMEAEDAFTALAKWAKLCGSAGAAAQPLSAILCQMLVRRLCTTCKEPYRPDPQMLAKANLPADIEKFYRPPTQQPVDEKSRPITCTTCQGSGYFERTGIFELLLVTQDIRQMIAAGANLRDIKSAARKANKMLYLQEQALRKVIAGVTSIQEVLRVSQPASKA